MMVCLWPSPILSAPSDAVNPLRGFPSFVGDCTGRAEDPVSHAMTPRSAGVARPFPSPSDAAAKMRNMSTHTTRAKGAVHP